MGEAVVTAQDVPDVTRVRPNPKPLSFFVSDASVSKPL